MKRWIATGAAVTVLSVALSQAPRSSSALAEPSPNQVVPLLEPLLVDIAVPEPLTGHRWGVESTGHVMVLLETGLAEMQGVVPRMAGAPPAPGLSMALPSWSDPWSTSVNLQLNGEALSVEVELCDAVGACESHRAIGHRTQPNAPVAQVLQGISAQIGRELTVDVAAWSQPETSDPYAGLVLGRAGAVLAGLHPPAETRHLGEPRRDPMVRAAYLDPRMPTGQAMAVRGYKDPAKRVESARTATLDRPDSVVRLADFAWSLLEVGQAEKARVVCEQLAERSPGDMRFTLLRARAALEAGDPRQARAVLAELQDAHRDHGGVVALQVAVADSLGGASPDLLVRWQTMDEDNPEPVRRRIKNYIAEDMKHEALGLTSELAMRGAAREAHGLTVALASDLGRWDVAADAAVELGAEDVAVRLRAVNGDRAPEDLAKMLANANSPEGKLAHATALHRTGMDVEAAGILRGLLRKNRWWPEALALQSKVLARLGDEEGAMVARERLLHADPLYYEDGR